MGLIYFKKTGWSVLGIIFLFTIHLPAYSQEKSARLELTLQEENGMRLVTAKALEIRGDSSDIPIEEIDLYFFVERTFSDLPIGDMFNTTDENGEVTIEFPSDLPGDPEGNVSIIVRILESDDFKDAEIRKIAKWGIPLKINQRKNERTLWSASANAPISLLILVNSLLVIAWGMILYFMYKIFLISKM